MENNTKVIPFAITKKREDDRQSCLDLLSYMKNYIPKTIDDPNNIYGVFEPIENSYLRKDKYFNTECSEFKKYVDEINNSNAGARINSHYDNISHIRRNIDWKSEKIIYNLKCDVQLIKK